MVIYYNGTDITNSVQIKKCIVHDTCGNRCDSLELEFENAAAWYAWGPKEDDEIIVAHGGYDSGSMYVAVAYPEDTVFRIYATSLPMDARAKGSKSYSQKSIKEIMEHCAAASGMEYDLHGLDGSNVIPFITRDDESCASFLCRILAFEGASLKCVNKKYMAIDLLYAQDRPALQTIQISTNQFSVEYNRDGTGYKSLAVQTPYATGEAVDSAAEESSPRYLENRLPAMTNAQAKRWAKGKLLTVNRCCERVKVQGLFNPGFTALERFDIIGGIDAAGEWLVEEAEHDLVNFTSSATMRRCVRSIS